MKEDIKIGIAGAGLIGGSIYKALRDKYKVLVSTRNDKTLSQIKDSSAQIDILKECDIIFVCTPMNKTLEMLDKLNEILSENTIVCDVCSLKEFLMHKKYNFKFIPTHPMAGTEHSGFENSFAEMFNGATWAITPLNSKEEDINKIENLIKFMGAKPLITTPKEHDEAVALISHMPMLISQAIFKTAEDNPLALKLASSGFRDMTRLAMSNAEMAQDMVVLNAENIQKAVLKLYASSGELLKGNYLSQISEIRKKRSKMFR